MGIGNHRQQTFYFRTTTRAFALALVAITSLATPPQAAAKALRADYKPPIEGIATDTFRPISTQTPQLATAKLLAVDGSDRSFHRTASGGVRGVVDGVELPAPAQSSTVVRSSAWNGNDGVAVGSTVDADGLVRSALWRTVGHGWKLVVHRFPIPCLRCVEARAEFQFVLYSKGFRGFVVASTGGTLSLLSKTGLEPIDFATPRSEQIQQCEVNDIVEDRQALWTLGSCAPEFREYRYPSVTRTGLLDRGTVGFGAFESGQLEEYGLALFGSNVVALEGKRGQNPGGYRYRKLDARTVFQQQPWSLLGESFAAHRNGPLQRVHMFRVEARRRSDQSWFEDHFDLLLDTTVGTQINLVEQDDPAHVASLNANALWPFRDGLEQRAVLRGHSITLRDEHFGARTLVDGEVQNEISSEFDNNENVLVSSREMVAVISTGGEPGAGSWSGYRTVGITTNGTLWSWNTELANTSTASVCTSHQTLGIVSSNLFTVVQASSPDRFASWRRDSVRFTACSISAQLRVVVGYQEHDGLAFPVVSTSLENAEFVSFRLATPGVPTKVFLHSGKVCLAISRATRPVRNFYLGYGDFEPKWRDSPGPVDTVCLGQPPSVSPA
jgi:hypothetical protein